MARNKPYQIPIAKPFLRWAGGKTQLLPELFKMLPSDHDKRCYFEPFLGGGALFFALRPTHAVLADKNDSLCNCYLHVKRSLPNVIRELASLRDRHIQDAETSYYAARDRYNELLTSPDSAFTTHGSETAALLIYLNKTGYNGLYRVNRAGQYNVPAGRHAKPTVLQADILATASGALQNATIMPVSFAIASQDIGDGDFVYCDPPYLPAVRGGHTNFTQGGFDELSHEALASSVRGMVDRGAKVLVSNSDSPFVRELYRGFKIREVRARRSINSNKAKRGKVKELIIAAGYRPRE